MTQDKSLVPGKSLNLWNKFVELWASEGHQFDHEQAEAGLQLLL